MADFPGNKGRVTKVQYNEAHFGVGTHEFRIQAYGWANLHFMLGELKASIDGAMKKVEAEMEKKESG